MAGLCEGGNEPAGSLKAIFGPQSQDSGWRALGGCRVVTEGGEAGWGAGLKMSRNNRGEGDASCTPSATEPPSSISITVSALVAYLYHHER
ncbi:hypothetical protein ANN_11184, partial [Periplaneta americana]